ncbi:MAG TPA: GDSL-type esterase/lipase family protein [Jatrophihabitans sp.]|jgi:lysophospholipase L1-like esterase|uniref:SGNH/GDSL hydrolase family protein n=1 Tax=Jatrophihabitans sp. TaxID=1932789 RepID=UPI002EF14A59
MSERLLIAGDSLVEGVGASNKHGWAQQVAEASSIPTDIIGIGGLTAQELYDRLQSEDISGYSVICLAIGLNDSRYRADQEQYETELDQFRSDLEQLLRMVTNGPRRVGLLSLLRVDEARSAPLKEDKKYFNVDIVRYEETLRDLASNFNVEVIEAPDMHLDPSNYDDGVHPSDSGHHQIFERVWEWLGK